MSLTSEARVFFQQTAQPEPIPDPRDEWIAYGIVVDTTGDGRPDMRFGIDAWGFHLAVARMT